jgi:ribosomal protein S18 acetylase RimI-like enzyme
VVAAVRLSHHADVSELPVPEGSGYASFKYPVASLSRLVVHPNFRRRGYGSSLATHIASEAMRSRARTHIAYVNAPIVHRVLRQLGFSSAGEIKYPWGDQALDTAVLVRSAVAGQTAAG